MDKPAPIVDRIAAVFGNRRRVSYYELLRDVFPADQFPKATGYSQYGGPPGCAMALGKALRKLNLRQSRDSGERIVYMPAGMNKIAVAREVPRD